MINAKAETVAEKPAFREAFKSRRCLIPANGFYEWKKLDAKAKQPHAITMKNRGLFGFMGLWSGGKTRRAASWCRKQQVAEIAGEYFDRFLFGGLPQP